MTAPKRRYDKTQWMLARERLRLEEFRPPAAEPDLSLRTAIADFFTKLDAQTGSNLHKIQAKWKTIAGETVAAHARPGRLDENILYVYVDSSVWLAEIKRFHSDGILRRIQKQTGPGAIKGVRFQVSPPKRTDPSDSG